MFEEWEWDSEKIELLWSPFTGKFDKDSMANLSSQARGTCANVACDLKCDFYLQDALSIGVCKEHAKYICLPLVADPLGLYAHAVPMKMVPASQVSTEETYTQPSEKQYEETSEENNENSQTSCASSVDEMIVYYSLSPGDNGVGRVHSEDESTDDLDLCDVYMREIYNFCNSMEVEGMPIEMEENTSTDEFPVYFPEKLTTRSLRCDNETADDLPRREFKTATYEDHPLHRPLSPRRRIAMEQSRLYVFEMMTQNGKDARK